MSCSNITELESNLIDNEKIDILLYLLAASTFAELLARVVLGLMVLHCLSCADSKGFQLSYLSV